MAGEKRTIRFVLCRPKFSANIGLACRAMKVMGISDLAIVGDPSDEDADQVRATAVHAADVYDRALRSETLEAAVADCTLVAGTTRRRGRRRKRAILLPEEFAERAGSLTGTIAVVFGNEESGLSSDELGHCSVAVTIPTGDAFPSLNLSHAVQIMAYVLFRHEWSKPSHTPVDTARVRDAVATIVESIEVGGASGGPDAAATRQLLIDLIGRAGPTEGEIRDLERIFLRIRYGEG